MVKFNRVISACVAHRKRIFYIILLLDLIMLILHLTLAPHTWFFHLDEEMNLPTIYQSLKLIIFGAMFFMIPQVRTVVKELKLFLRTLGLGMIALGIDEGFQIHENIYRIFEWFPWLHPSRIVEVSMTMGYRSSLWILYYLPIIFLFVLWLGYWTRYFQKTIPYNFKLILIAGVSLFLVLLTEIMSSTGEFSHHWYFWLITIEEMAELIFATSLVGLGLISLGSKKQQSSGEDDKISHAR